MINNIRHNIPQHTGEQEMGHRVIQKKETKVRREKHSEHYNTLKCKHINVTLKCTYCKTSTTLRCESRMKRKRKEMTGEHLNMSNVAGKGKIMKYSQYPAG